MKIDLRLTLPFVFPLAIIAIARVVFAVSGAPWSDDVAEIMAAVATIIGVPGGTVFMVVLFDDEKPIGHINLWSKSDD